MATEEPAYSASGAGIAFFTERVAAESAHRLTVLPSYDAGFGLKSADIPGAIRDRRLAAGCAPAGALGGIAPLFALSSLPFVATCLEDARKLFDKAQPLYAQCFASQGQRLLYATPYASSGLWAAKPIVLPSDLVALRVAVPDATGAEVFKAAKADAIRLPTAETEPRIASGSVQAVLCSSDKRWERLTHFTEIGYATPLSFATLAAPLYDRLPDALKTAVDRAASATQAHMWERKDNPVTITPIDKVTPELRGMFARAAIGVIERWKSDAGPEAAKLLA